MTLWKVTYELNGAPFDPEIEGATPTRVLYHAVWPLEHKLKAGDVLVLTLKTVTEGDKQ